MRRGRRGRKTKRNRKRSRWRRGRKGPNLAAVVAHELLELLGVGVVVLVVTDRGRLGGMR